MSALWRRLGIAAYWLGWPGLWLMLRWSHRTRLLLICQGEFMVLRGWLGNGEWGLPGGGLHRNEKPIDGLLREVAEETGVTLLPAQITYAYNAYGKQRGLKFHYYAYVCEIDAKPITRSQPYEISAITWQPLSAPTAPLNNDAKALLAWWQNKK